ncbi:hypothetical protein HXX76_009862 [Chlamydomonas incerta]|uniref:Uncharacterized protein n=1 Tax=Chlamydomonas incerta TaxID=51695 RepID=A0A835VZ18_CHLIN|nr:hypothetical protein HXX76_009862 [Chlamydomonas incerta]|eukprot:KAG2430889.1 hypothetical protein HXX76_009862 [Chlamydomonas incerta]
MRSANVLLLAACLLLGVHDSVAQGTVRPGSKVRLPRGSPLTLARQPPPRRAAVASPPLGGHSTAEPRPPVPVATHPSPPVALPPPAPPLPAPPVVYRNDQILEIEPGQACDPTANFTRVSGPACALVAGTVDAPNGNNYLSGLPIWPASGPRFPRFSYLLMTSAGQLSTIRFAGGAAWSIDGASGNVTRFETSTRRRAQEVAPSTSPAPTPAPAPVPAPGPAVALVLRSDGSFVFTRADGSPTGVGSATLGVSRVAAGGGANAPFTMRLLDFPEQVPSLDLAIYNKHGELSWSLFGGGDDA